jgi:hypothetical protein
MPIDGQIIHLAAMDHTLSKTLVIVPGFRIEFIIRDPVHSFLRAQTCELAGAPRSSFASLVTVVCHETKMPVRKTSSCGYFYQWRENEFVLIFRAIYLLICGKSRNGSRWIIPLARERRGSVLLPRRNSVPRPRPDTSIEIDGYRVHNNNDLAVTINRYPQLVRC